MGILSDLVPTNLRAETAKFLADSSYNPQFEYHRTFSDSELTQWGIPSEKFYRHALSQLNLMLYPPLKGRLLTQEEVVHQVENLQQQLQLTTFLPVRFTSTMIARCRVDSSGITFRLPITFDQTIFNRLLRHEIETHYLRRLNALLVSTSRPLNSIDVKTEEGLAYLHGYLEDTNPFFRNAYLNYVALWIAQQGSFRDAYSVLLNYHVPSTVAFQIALHVKRGITDTSKPGGVTKSLIYLEGAYNVWQWIIDTNNDPKKLYLGKVSLEEVNQLENPSLELCLHYPTFMQDIARYRDRIKVIGEVNHFQEIDL